MHERRYLELARQRRMDRSACSLRPEEDAHREGVVSRKCINEHYYKPLQRDENVAEEIPTWRVLY